MKAAAGVDDGMSDRLFKISELARRSGVNVSTIKHYLREGLITPVRRTGKTMAWYDENAVRRIRLIRSLQQERFLPLAVIAGILDDREESVHGYPAPQTGIEPERLTLPQLVDRCGFSEEAILDLVEAGIIHPEASPRGPEFDELDRTIVEIVKQREKQGLSFSYSTQLLGAYASALDRAVEEDVHLFATQVMTDASPAEALKLINADDDTINSFLFYARRKLNRAISERALSQLVAFEMRLAAVSPFPLPGRVLPATADAGRFAWFCALARTTLQPGIVGNTKHREADAEDPPSVLIVVSEIDTIAGAAHQRDITTAIHKIIASVNHLRTVAETTATTLDEAVARLCAAASLVALPDLLHTTAPGKQALIESAADMERIVSEGHIGPKWLNATIREELVPAVYARGKGGWDGS